MGSNPKKAVAKKTVATSAENETETGAGPKPFSSSVKGNALTKVRSGFVGKKVAAPKITAEKLVQTDHPGVALVTGDKPSLEYWKLLAEERGRQLEQVHREKYELETKNETLEEEIVRLKQENNSLKEEVSTLESMVEDAKKLAEYFEALPDSEEEDSDE
jgi:cell division protein FtsB